MVFPNGTVIFKIHHEKPCILQYGKNKGTNDYARPSDQPNCQKLSPF